MHWLNNIGPIILILNGKTSKFPQPEHWILEHWTIQNLLGRLINESTNFQMFNIQIPENLFSKMLKAWIADDILHFSDFVNDGLWFL